MSEAEKALYEQFSDDPELAYAMKLSMMEEEASRIVVPEEPSNETDPSQVVNILFRLPDGKKFQRKFSVDNKVEEVINYLKKESGKYGSVFRIIMSGFPKKVVEVSPKTLKEAGFSKQESVIVEII